jgi:hypothetical protein
MASGVCILAFPTKLSDLVRVLWEGFSMTAKLQFAATSVVAVALFAMNPVHADTVWTFATPTGAQTQSHNYTANDGTLLNAQAFGPNGGAGMSTPGPVQLFGKNNGGDENGVGLTNDPSGDHEITKGSFIQLTIDHLLNLTGLSFMAGSTTSGEAWAVYGTNTAGTIGSGTIPAGATLLLSCDSSISGSNCEGLKPFNNPMGFNFLDVTETTAGGNILLVELDGTRPVPGPIAGAGLPGLIAACSGLLALARRRRQKFV